MRSVQSARFKGWMAALRDPRAQARIASRIVRIESGNMGDVRSLRGGLSEVRIDYGPGYRLYFTVRGGSVILLLVGGDKGSQSRDISAARSLLSDLEQGHAMADLENLDD